MGLSEYLDHTGNPTRWKLCAVIAVLIHVAVLAGSGLLMTQKTEYGMAAAVAGGGAPKVVQPPEEVTVELENNSEDGPVEKRKPKPTPVAPKGIGGRVSGQVAAVPVYYLNPPPSYPLGARARKEEGVVTLHADVDAQGKVTSVVLLKGCGFTDLDESAVEAVKAWQFKPAQIAGITISTSVNIPIRFRLKEVQ